MKIKFVILVLLVVLTTCGCTVEYNLVIDENNNYYETTKFISEGNENVEKDYLYMLYLEELPIYFSQNNPYDDPDQEFSSDDVNKKIPEFTYYDKSILENQYGYIATYKAKYSNNDYDDSRILKSAFADIKVNKYLNQDSYYLNFSNLKIFNAENYITNIKVDITISDKYVVLDNNASKVNGNVYTWEFNNVNSKLIFRYQDKEKDNNEEVQPPEEDNSIIYVVIGLLGFFVILFIIFKIKKY